MALVEVERHDGVAHAVLRDPPLNRFSLDLARDLSAAVKEVGSSNARALLLRAEGEHFSAGADVNMFIGLTEEEARGGLGEFIDMVHELERLPIPTLAALQGACVAAGLEVAMGCDLIWAADNAQLGQLEALIGATPFAGGSQRLVGRVGAGRAKEMVLTGGLYPAEKMLEWGLVQRVVPVDALEEKASRFAERLAAGPTRAHAVTKEVMRTQLERGLEEADAILPALGAKVMVTDDLQNGVKVFLEKGPGQAVFEGR
jgi:enoyl-CoA hydratase